ncbi:MAG: hypothetical protein N3A59_04965 [Thermodesulfovibrionales bacterium]|nr:hypothetical protein [Thermodesulfovibrionales bacterium]
MDTWIQELYRVSIYSTLWWRQVQENLGDILEDRGLRKLIGLTSISSVSTVGS